MKNFDLTLVADKGSPNVQLTIKNISPYCYKVLSNHLILDGEIEQDSFVITDKSNGNTLEYQGITAKSVPTYIELNPEQCMSSEIIDLSQFYGLDYNNGYEIYFRTSLTYMPCDQLVEISGLVESNHVDIFN